MLTFSRWFSQPLQLSGISVEHRALEEAVRRCTSNARPSVGGLAPARDGPGPAIYDGGTSLGEQILSRHSTAAAVSFGTAMRDHSSATNEKDGPVRGAGCMVHGADLKDGQ